MTTVPFFFSHFPYNYGEYEIWRIFRRWERVEDVFISRRLNQRGHKFCFVRFQGITNPGALEQQLDNIRIGNMKLHVNMPKYQQSENLIYRPRGSSLMGGNRKFSKGDQKNTMTQKYKKVWRRKEETKTYVQAVKGGTESEETNGNTG